MHGFEFGRASGMAPRARQVFDGIHSWCSDANLLHPVLSMTDILPTVKMFIFVQDCCLQGPLQIIWWFCCRCSCCNWSGILICQNTDMYFTDLAVFLLRLLMVYYWDSLHELFFWSTWILSFRPNFPPLVLFFTFSWVAGGGVGCGGCVMCFCFCH